MRLFVDKLCNIDFSYLHPTRGLVGETWLANIELVGQLDDQGMVCDFGIVKAMLREWLDEALDHKLLIPSRAEHLSLEDKPNNHKALQWKYQQNRISIESPADALTHIDCQNISEESVALWCIDQLKSKFPSSVEKIHLSFTPEDISGPYYHYSHGLKKHSGNCQRIAHGHRSKIMIWRNDTLAEADMKAWALHWKDIYVGSKADSCPAQASENVAFQYQAQQGFFFLELPKSQCYFIDSDSTIECIAGHIAQTLKKQYPNDDIRVKAFEGFAKGAISDA